MARSLSTVWEKESESDCNASNVVEPTNRAATEFCQTSAENIGNFLSLFLLLLLVVTLLSVFNKFAVGHD